MHIWHSRMKYIPVINVFEVRGKDCACAPGVVRAAKCGQCRLVQNGDLNALFVHQESCVDPFIFFLSAVYNKFRELSLLKIFI